MRENSHSPRGFSQKPIHFTRRQALASIHVTSHGGNYRRGVGVLGNSVLDNQAWGSVGVGGPNRRISGCREHLLLARNPLQSHLEGLGEERLWMGAALLLGLAQTWL